MLSFLLFLVLAIVLLGVSVLRLILHGLFSRNGFSAKKEHVRKEGEVSIDYVPPRRDLRDSRPGNGTGNDYVDYEEVRD
ncbi:MAG: DUF4834 family protein [Bacteroidales bacterium]|nr:DUF4834 family protein [Bacteroidales bacterium]MDE7072582.1 DUF4834 family protein [Bacteroidales bacterium]